MGAKLHIHPANAEPFEVKIGNTATIGRTRENTVCLNFSPLVSRQHALIRCHNTSQYQVIDLGSRNGTYVNEQRVIMPVILEPGACIRVADNNITFLADDAGFEDAAVTVAGGTVGSSGVFNRSVALLVCDIRGFSRMSENVPAAEVAQILGEWFRETRNLVQSTQGTIDKYIGDALLAYWAGPGGSVDCDAAFGTAQQLLRLAAERAWPNRDPLKIAVALHYGRVTFSDMGLSAERDATILGDVVNTVFRLEAVAKELNRGLVLSEDFADQLSEQPALKDFGEQTLKGKTRAVRVFGLTE
ncbi:MAG: adenylate cyclase [Chthoniobacter sp.]|jgi:adenylate cyclase|nr:adenylate cyclase [Chthoniobacter sp.]